MSEVSQLQGQLQKGATTRKALVRAYILTISKFVSLYLFPKEKGPEASTLLWPLANSLTADEHFLNISDQI